MPLSVKLTGFEGPLDLLLHLIDKNKIDIYDIPIALITDQYFAYIEELDTENLEVTSDFIVMAATLLDIKSRMLLPKDEEEEEEEDPREELVQRLLEYKRFKHISGLLQERLQETGSVLERQQNLPAEVRKYKPPLDLDALLVNVSLDRLHKVFLDILKRNREKINPRAAGFGKIKKERVSLPGCMLQVERKAIEKGKISFRAVLEDNADREDIVVTFLAVLELINRGRIRIRQESLSEDIYIEAVQTDPDMAGVYDDDDMPSLDY